MDWAFIVEIPFYALLGFILFIPLVLLTAAINKKIFEEGLNDLNGYLKNWINSVGKGTLPKLFKITGISTLIFLLAFFAYALCRLGDATMPYTSSFVKHLGNKKVQWSIEQRENDWRNLKFNYHEISEIKGDKAVWGDIKKALGKTDVRLFRTSFYFFVIILIAAFIDLANREFRRKRGIRLLAIALLGIFLSQSLWIERQANYVENLVSGYEGKYLEKHQPDKWWPWLPDSYPYIQQIESNTLCIDCHKIKR